MLRWLGAAPAVAVADGLAGIVASALLGPLVAAVLAIVLSPLTLVGPVRSVEPAGPLYLDWTVLGFGALALFLLLSGAAAVMSSRQAARRAGLTGASPTRGAPVAAILRAE